MGEILHVAYKKYTIKIIGSDRKVAHMRRNAKAVASCWHTKSMYIDEDLG